MFNSEAEIETLRNELRQALFTGHATSFIDGAAQRMTQYEHYLNAGLRSAIPVIFALETAIKAQDWPRATQMVEMAAKTIYAAEQLNPDDDLSGEPVDIFAEELIRFMRQHISVLFKTVDTTDLGDVLFRSELISAWVKAAIVDMTKPDLQGFAPDIYDPSQVDVIIDSVRDNREILKIDGKYYIPIDVVHDTVNESARQILTITRDLRNYDKKTAAQIISKLHEVINLQPYAASPDILLVRIRKTLKEAIAYLESLP